MHNSSLYHVKINLHKQSMLNYGNITKIEKFGTQFWKPNIMVLRKCTPKPKLDIVLNVQG